VRKDTLLASYPGRDVENADRYLYRDLSHLRSLGMPLARYDAELGGYAFDNALYYERLYRGVYSARAPARGGTRTLVTRLEIMLVLLLGKTARAQIGQRVHLPGDKVGKHLKRLEYTALPPYEPADFLEFSQDRHGRWELLNDQGLVKGAGWEEFRGLPHWGKKLPQREKMADLKQRLMTMERRIIRLEHQLRGR
jgi:hypothetical protein